VRRKFTASDTAQVAAHVIAGGKGAPDRTSTWSARVVFPAMVACCAWLAASPVARGDPIQPNPQPRPEPNPVSAPRAQPQPLDPVIADLEERTFRFF